jgi:hypothetical protein
MLVVIVPRGPPHNQRATGSTFMRQQLNSTSNTSRTTRLTFLVNSSPVLLLVRGTRASFLCHGSRCEDTLESLATQQDL